MTVENDKITELLEKLSVSIHPAVRALDISVFVSGMLRENKINLYEAYLLKFEVVSLERLSYLQPAWYNSPHISTCINLLNMKMLAYLYNDDKTAEVLDTWAKEAYNLNHEKRTHYILDSYIEYLNFAQNEQQQQQLLQNLLNIRNNKKKSFNKGPYHSESFPDDYCIPEQMLLDNRFFTDEDKQLGKDIENLLVELNLLD